MKAILTAGWMLVVLGGWICGAWSHAAEPADAKSTRIEFEKLAADLPYLALNSVLYDQSDHRFKAAKSADRDTHFRILAKVTDGSYPQKDLLALLSHRDPKTRTLAAVALFDREDPTVLPELVKLCDDPQATFDGHGSLSAEWLAGSGIGPPRKEQTVGSVATAMVTSYLSPAGFGYGVRHASEPGFAEYWQARRNREHCASWFAVQLARASQGTYPTPQESLPRIRALRTRIDGLPADYRAWVLLWLRGEMSGNALATEQEMVALCRQLGAEKLMLMLQKKLPNDDPDLQPRSNNNWSYQQMMDFVLTHADQLLRPNGSEALLACERQEREYQAHGITDPMITPQWAIAAARLAPQQASKILHGAMERFQGEFKSDARASLCVALWQLGGKTEAEFILDAFYQEPPAKGAFPSSRARCIAELGADPHGREILVRLIRDKRLASLGWQPLEQLVRVMNRGRATPVVSEAELAEARHPLGPGHYDRSQAEAHEKYPRETRELIARLDNWRAALRKSIDSPEKPQLRPSVE